MVAPYFKTAVIFGFAGNVAVVAAGLMATAAMAQSSLLKNA